MVSYGGQCHDMEQAVLCVVSGKLSSCLSSFNGKTFFDDSLCVSFPSIGCGVRSGSFAHAGDLFLVSHEPFEFFSKDVR